MVEKLFELLMSRSIDDGKPLPGWLQSVVDRKSDRGQFFEQSKQLDAALQSSANRRRAEMFKGGNTDSTESVLPMVVRESSRGQVNTKRWIGVIAATAAMLLLAFLPGRTPSPAPPPTFEPAEVAQLLELVPSRIFAMLNSGIEISQNHLADVSPLANLKLPQPPQRLPELEELFVQFESPMRQELDLLITDIHTMAKKLPKF